MTRTPTNGSRRRAEAWWPLIRDISSFALGTGLLVSQVAVVDPEPLLVGAGLALIGVTGTGRVQEWARGRRAAGENES